MRHRSKTVALASMVLMLGACSSHLQSTSGTSYLARYDRLGYDAAGPAPGENGDMVNVDADVRRIASVEPRLEFPARIGLARVSYQGLTAIPGDEAMIWQETLEDIGEAYGEFVPVSPLIASMVAGPAPANGDRTAAIIADIRRGAARQHLDYVFVYEVGSSSREKSNAVSLADLTIVGMFVLPTRNVEVEASASGLLLDVRNGYPYATLTGHAEKSSLSRVVSSQSTRRDLADTAEERAVADLASEVAGTLKGLRDRAASNAESIGE